MTRELKVKTCSVASRVIFCCLLVGEFVPPYVTSSGSAQTTDVARSPSVVTASQILACGMPDDGQNHVPPDWTSFVPPARGHSYTDPVFGCVITRITDAIKDGVGEHHCYATLTPMSADDSKLLLVNAHGAYFVTDLLGSIVVPPDKMPPNNAGMLVWDAADGNVFYFTQGNSLMKATIRGRTVKVSQVHKFAEYDVVLLPDKTDLSIDGNSFAMWGGTTREADRLSIFTYNMKTNVKKTPYVTGCLQNVSFSQGACVHGITQTADDNVIIDFAGEGTCNECGNRLWDGNRLVHIQDATNHMDTGFDLSGNPIFIAVSNSSTLAGVKNPCPSGFGLDVRLQDNLSSATCLLDKQPSWHVSYRGNASQPWAAISFFDDRKPGPELFNADRNFQPPSQANWQLYEDEILLARVDGGTIYRMAHARARSAEGYWAQPHAAISRDGEYVIFDSNMAFARTACPTGIADCSDVYWIKVR